MCLQNTGLCGVCGRCSVCSVGHVYGVCGVCGVCMRTCLCCVDVSFVEKQFVFDELWQTPCFRPHSVIAHQRERWRTLPPTLTTLDSYKLPLTTPLHLTPFQILLMKPLTLDSILASKRYKEDICRLLHAFLSHESGVLKMMGCV